MASGQNLAVSAVILFGLTAVIMFMQKNRMSTEEYTLIQSCRIAQGHLQVDAHECDSLEEHFFEWDTRVPCNAGFKDDTYYYTPRMFFNLVEQNSNMSWGQAMNLVNDKVCGPVATDPDFEIFVARKREGRLEKRDLLVTTAAAVGGVSVGFLKFLGAALGLMAWLMQNYKACSGKLGWSSVGVNDLEDTAQCSSDPFVEPTKCRKYHWRGPSGWWYDVALGHRNWLNRGCNRHDDCLINNKYWSLDRDECDDGLADRAYECRKDNYFWKRSRCRDGKLFSGMVYNAMIGCPNCQSCWFDMTPCPKPHNNRSGRAAWNYYGGFRTQKAPKNEYDKTYDIMKTVLSKGSGATSTFRHTGKGSAL